MTEPGMTLERAKEITKFVSQITPPSAFYSDMQEFLGSRYATTYEINKLVNEAIGFISGYTAHGEKVKKLVELLKKSKRKHSVCEDPFYNCPKSGECINGSLDKDFCDCGADEWNSEVDKALADYKREEEYSPEEIQMTCQHMFYWKNGICIRCGQRKSK